MKKTILLSKEALGISLLVGKEVIKLDETLSLEKAEKLAVQFPHYITLKEEQYAKPQSPRPAKVAENAVTGES